MIALQCERCGASMERRNGAKFCSAKCRKAASRAGHARQDGRSGVTQGGDTGRVTLSTVRVYPNSKPLSEVECRVLGLRYPGSDDGVYEVA